MARYWYSYKITSVSAPAIYTPSNYGYMSSNPMCALGVARPCAIYAQGPHPSGTLSSISTRLQTYIGQTVVAVYPKYAYKTSIP